MKVAHIINGLHMGGAEKLVVDTLPILKKLGLDLELIVLNGEDTPLFDRLKDSTIKITRLGRSLYDPLHIIRIARRLDNYDVVHVHLFPSQYYVAIAKRISFSKVKLVFTEHNTSNRRLEKKWLKPLEQWVYSAYSKIICITPEVSEVLREKLDVSSEKLTVIYNGVDLQNINDAEPSDRSAFNLTQSDTVLIMVAAFREQKNHDLLIKCFAELPERFKLLLVGEGKRKHELLKLTERLKLTKRVNFLGVRTDVYELFKMSDVAVLASHWEGFGLSAVEAMACGVPLLASNVSGLADVVGDGGVLFENDDITDLVTKVLSLEDETSQSNIVKRGIQRAAEFSLETMVGKINVVYLGLFSKK